MHLMHRFWASLLVLLTCISNAHVLMPYARAEECYKQLCYSTFLHCFDLTC